MHIVLIDHNRQCLAQLKKILEQTNPIDQIFIFEDALLALDFIEDNPVDEVFIEVSMPNKTGFALTREIKKRDKQIKVILLAYSKSYAMEAWNAHANYFIEKPVTVNDILEMRE